MVWMRRRPAIVAVYAPSVIPAVSMAAVTVPLPSGPVTATVRERFFRPGDGRRHRSQVCPGTFEAGSA